MAGLFGRGRDALEMRTSAISRPVKVAIVFAIIFTLLSWVFLALGFDIAYMRQWLPFLLEGVPLTLVISLVSIALAIPLALFGALGRLSRNPIPYGASTFYVSFIRGTPLIVQIFFIYNALPQLATFAPTWLSGYLILDIVPSGILALGINYGAYMTEIFRAGIQSVGHGQVEAAHALAMTGGQTMRRIVLPQAVRVIIPPTGNEFIAMLKDSALVGLAGTQELFFRAIQAGRRDFKTLEMLVVAAAIYWILTSIFSVFQSRLESRMARGYVREQPHGH